MIKGPSLSTRHQAITPNLQSCLNSGTAAGGEANNSHGSTTMPLRAKRECPVKWKIVQLKVFLTELSRRERRRRVNSKTGMPEIPGLLIEYPWERIEENITKH